jgi:uncharacterized protein (TIRG00374 family)
MLFLSIGIGLMYWAFYNMDMQEVFSSLKNANYSWVFLAFICGVLSHLSRAMRWRYLLAPMGYKIPVLHSFYAVMSGYLMNFIVPRLGEVSRCAMINRTDKVPFEKLVGTVVIERVVDLLITAIISIAILFTQYDLLQSFIAQLLGKSAAGSQTLMLLVAIAVFGLLGLYLVLKFRTKLTHIVLLDKAYKLWDGVLDGLKSIVKLKYPWSFVLHSLFIWTMYFMMSWLIFYSLDGTSHLGISAGLTVLLAGTLAIIIPVPGGVGTYHTIVPAALLLYDINEMDGKTYAIIGHSTQMLMIFMVGGISLILGGLAAKKNIVIAPKNEGDA